MYFASPIILRVYIYMQVKEYIARAKAWRNRLLPKSSVGRRSPSSFLISLLVLRAYENQKSSQTYGYRGHNEAKR